jgi:hypothetical protein
LIELSDHPDDRIVRGLRFDVERPGQLVDDLADSSSAITAVPDEARGGIQPVNPIRCAIEYDRILIDVPTTDVGTPFRAVR